MGKEGDFIVGGGSTMQCADDVLLSYMFKKKGKEILTHDIILITSTILS